MKSDEELMLAYCAGDSASFGELFARYAPILERVLRRFGPSQDQLADLTSYSKHSCNCIALVTTFAGNLALMLHCPNEQPAHQLVGHATVSLLLLVCIGVGIVLARVRSRQMSTIRRNANE